MGLTDGAVLRRAIAKDQALTMEDVDLPPGRRIDELWREQWEHFAVRPGTAAATAAAEAAI